MAVRAQFGATVVRAQAHLGPGQPADHRRCIRVAKSGPPVHGVKELLLA